MGGLLRTLESEIGLYETDYIFVSSGYPPRVEGRMDQLDFFTQSIAGFDWVCIRPWLGIPIAPGKIEGPCTTSEFLGITLDTVLF